MPEESKTIGELQSALLAKDDELKLEKAKTHELQVKVDALTKEKADLADLNAKLLLRVGVTKESNLNEDVPPSDPLEYMIYWQTKNKKRG